MKKMKQKKAFQGGINVTDLSFKKGTPNIRTVKPPSTSASASIVSTSTAQLVSRQQQSRTSTVIRGPTPPPEEENLMFKPTAVSMKPAPRKQHRRKTKSRVKKVPDFFTPEKGVLLLGTLRPNGVCDVVPNDQSASTAQRKSSKSHRSQKAAPQVCVQMSETPLELQEDKPIVLSWQPLGSPMRRMKRAMRFVQQNTCVTQRVTVDVGGIAR
jgi:hypothetical protein